MMASPTTVVIVTTGGFGAQEDGSSLDELWRPSREQQATLGGFAICVLAGLLAGGAAYGSLDSTQQTVAIASATAAAAAGALCCIAAGASCANRHRNPVATGESA